MMKINAFEQVQKLYEDSVQKKQDPFFAHEKEKGKAERAAVYQPSEEKAVTGTSAESKLSDEAKALLAKIREKYGNMDIMVGDFSTEEEAQAMLARGTKEYSVLFTSDELEKMAADEEYANENFNRIDEAVKTMQDIADQLAEEDSDTQIDRIGISFGSDGKMEIFAALREASDKQAERIEKAREEKAQEAKEDEKKAETEKTSPFADRAPRPEKTALVRASNLNELVEKIKEMNWDVIEAKYPPKEGGKIDFTA